MMSFAVPLLSKYHSTNRVFWQLQIDTPQGQRADDGVGDREPAAAVRVVFEVTDPLLSG